VFFNPVPFVLKLSMAVQVLCRRDQDAAAGLHRETADRWQVGRHGRLDMKRGAPVANNPSLEIATTGDSMGA
ncbi:MAG TPA: hypothetical protein PLB55_21095, partial [Prosthecobacter sp.]|nr:hypothetical protein [Prosthecobacter sp.]